MNTLMYMHPLTAKQLAIARHELGYEVVGPISKMLACGDLGKLHAACAVAARDAHDALARTRRDGGVE